MCSRTPQQLETDFRVLKSVEFAFNAGRVAWQLMGNQIKKYIVKIVNMSQKLTYAKTCKGKIKVLMKSEISTKTCVYKICSCWNPMKKHTNDEEPSCLARPPPPPLSVKQLGLSTSCLHYINFITWTVEDISTRRHCNLAININVLFESKSIPAHTPLTFCTSWYKSVLSSAVLSMSV